MLFVTIEQKMNKETVGAALFLSKEPFIFSFVTSCNVSELNIFKLIFKN